MVREDERFRAESSRIFKPLRRDRFKVSLDPRFRGVLSEERFSSVVSGDGRRRRRAEHLQNLYVDGAETTKGASRRHEDRLTYLTQLARGEILGESSSDEERAESEGPEESESEEELDETGVEEKSSSVLQIPGDEEVPTGEATSRLAILNCDWVNLRAVDLLVVLQSFCPAGTALKSVRIYPSDFGLKAMEIENRYGPQGIWNEKTDKTEDEVYDDLEASEATQEDFRRRSGKAGVVFHEELRVRGLTKDEDPDMDSLTQQKKSGFNQEALRKYELAKLKYYFAVVECDSVETASILYDRMDGIEFEHSSVAFDLRFIPDDVSFEDRTLKDECLGGDAETVLAKYNPPEFVVKALQHTNVDCTWDQDERQRDTVLSNFSKWRELQESDFQQYLASDASSDEDEETVRNKRNALLGDDQEVEDDDFFAPEPEEEVDGVDKVMTYMPELHEEIKSKVAAKSGEEETPFEAQQRKLAEARKKKRALRKSGKLGDNNEENAPDPTLELMFDDNDAEVGDYDIREIEKAERSKTRKKKKRSSISTIFALYYHEIGLRQRKSITSPLTWRTVALQGFLRRMAALVSIPLLPNSARLLQ